MKLFADAFLGIAVAAGALGAPPRGASVTRAQAVAVAAADVPPEQFHVAYANGNATDVWITWLRPGAGLASSHPRCVSPDGAFAPAAAVVKTYTDANVSSGCRSDWEHAPEGASWRHPCVPWSGLIMTARLTALAPNKVVRYSCGDDAAAGGMGSEMNFTSAPEVGESSTVFSFYGDQGTRRADPRYLGAALVRDAILADSSVRFALLGGDVAYANGNQTVWDVYGRAQEALFSHIPTLFTPGNHDGEL